MADLSKITLPSGTTYNLKDAQAREDIATIEAAVSGGVSFLGITTTELTDGSTTSSIVVSGETYSAINGALVIYGDDEFVYSSSDSKWHRFGPAGTFGALAYKDSASGSYTPAGTISTPTFTGTSKSVAVSGTPSGYVSISGYDVETSEAFEGGANGSTSGITSVYVDVVPAGTVSQPTFTGSSLTSTGTFTPAGSVTVSTNATTNKTATVSSTSGTATYTPSGTVSQPTFSGTAGTVSVSGTPEGSITVNGTYGNVVTGYEDYTKIEIPDMVTNVTSGSTEISVEGTCAGTVSAPTISVSTAGSTTSIKNPTSVTVAKTIATAAPGSTAPDNAVTYYAVSGETLSLYQIGYTTGASITTSNVTVKTGDASYSATAPTFTGSTITSTGTATPNISIGKTSGDIYLAATFAGSETTSEGTFTPSGSVSQPTFTGTGARLVTGNIAVPNTYTATFSGTAGDVSVSGTPSGTVSQPTFSGNTFRLTTSFTGNSLNSTGTYTPEGTISTPTFTGTQDTITVS